MTNRLLYRFLLTVLFFISLSAIAVFAQQPTQVYPTKKPAPTEIRPDLMVLTDELVQEQWGASLDLVNAPADQKQVEPGQCIRFAVLATGDGRDQAFKTSTISVEFTFANKTTSLGVAPPLAIKRIKPEGGDFVTEALAAANIKNPMESMVTIAASQARWCAPPDVQDGTAKIVATATLQNGKVIQLKPRPLSIKSFESARAKPAFKNLETLAAWVQTYHFNPDPAQLLLGLRVVGSDPKARTTFNIMSFFIAAMKQSPVAAADILRHMPSEARDTRIYSLPLLRMAGYDIEGHLADFDDRVKLGVLTMALPDPVDISPDELLPNKMDMLWASFFATGRIEPIRKLASMLAWRDDYDAFKKMRESGQKPTELTESIMRGVVYMAAGWSMNSISQNDGLLTDYIEAFKASPETPANVKAELTNLHTNPAFRRP